MGNLLGNWSFASTKSCAEMTVWKMTQLTSVWTQALKCPKAGKLFNCTITFMPLIIFGCNHTKEYWLAFSLAEVEEVTSKLIKKAVLELKAMICQSWKSEVWKFLIEPGNLTPTTASSLSEPSSPEGVPKSLRKSDRVSPGAGSVQLQDSIH